MRKYAFLMIVMLMGVSQVGFASASKGAATVQQLAAQGKPAAMILLGDMYATGSGVPVSDVKALQWYKKAAAMHSVFGMTNLGRIYFYGLYDVPKSNKIAAAWYAKAAKKGYGRAQRHLATLYFIGRGVAKNDIEAYAWWGLAAASGDKLAKRYQRIVRPTMSREALRLANEKVLLYERLYGYSFQD
jgi:uncharacterized protein